MRIALIFLVLVIVYIIVGRICAVAARENGWFDSMWEIRKEVQMFMMTLFWPVVSIPAICIGIYWIGKLLFYYFPELVVAFIRDVIKK
jgi:hypothetical protein